MGYNYHRAFRTRRSGVHGSCFLLFAATLLSSAGAMAQEGATLTVDLAQVKAKVSPQLYGLMTEEIN
jgi:hypothetical protein